MVTVAGWLVERAWIAAQVAASGVHVHEAACCGVKFGGSLVSLTHSGSMAPTRIRAPAD